MKSHFVDGYEYYALTNKFEEEKLLNLLNLLNRDIQIRDLFFSDFGAALRGRNVKIEPGNCFVSGSEAADYYTSYVQKAIKSGFQKSMYDILACSIPLKQDIEKLKTNGAFVEKIQNLLFCKNCKEFVFSSVCTKCSNNAQQIRAYSLPENVENYWRFEPGRFLEGMCFAALKDIPNIEIKPFVKYTVRGERNDLGDIDVLLKTKGSYRFNIPDDLHLDNRYIGILATIGDDPETKQINKLEGIKVPTIFVSVEKFKKRTLLDSFTDVRTDAEFPKKLKEYISRLVIRSPSES